MNPTVEDAASGESNHGPASRDANASEAPMSWSEIFSRHESMLAAHLELLRSLKAHLAPQGEALRSLSTMVGKTVQAMNQSKILRKQTLSSKSATDNASTSTSQPASSSNMSGTHQTHTPQSTDAETSSSNTNAANNGKRRKRARAEKDKEQEGDPVLDARPNHQPQSDPGAEPEPRASKRKREALSFPGDNEDVHSIIPVSLETEDISTEVQRRLQIMEERRRKEETTEQPEKRKRQSVASTESVSSAGGGSSSGTRPKKKRARLGMAAAADDELKRAGDAASEVDAEAEGRAKKQRRTSR